MTTMPSRGSFVQDSTGLATITLTVGAVPAGAAMIAVVAIGSTTVTITSPTGWRVLVPQTTIGTRRFAIFGKTRGQLDDGTPHSDTGTTYTFTVSAATTLRATLVYATGVPAVAEWQVGAVRLRSAVGTSPRFANVAPSVTTTAPNSLAVVLSVEATAAAESAISSLAGATAWGFAAQGTGGQPSVIETVHVSYIEQVTAGATGDVTITYPNTQDSNGAAVQIILPPTPDTVVGLPVKLAAVGDTLVDGRLSIWDGTKAVSPSAIRTVQPGLPSSTALLAKAGFKVAHRLGSANWPEHSLHGATQSLLRGVDALEFSIGRSSDGVYFGLHDATLDRTSGVTGVNPTTLTWAQIQASYQILSSITDDASQPNRPYLSLVDVLAAYPNVVFFIDPKNLPFADMVALFQWLKDTYPNATERFVLKYYFDYVALKNAVMDLGFKSWGYLYTADLANVNFVSLCSRWTWLGLENSATQASWDTVKAQNPRVLGHIAQTLAAYQSGITKGAVGGMVAGVKQVMGF